MAGVMGSNMCWLTGWLFCAEAGPSALDLPEPKLEPEGEAPSSTLAQQGSGGLLLSWPSRGASGPVAAFTPAPVLPAAPGAGLSAGATTLRPSAATVAGTPLQKPPCSSQAALLYPHQIHQRIAFEALPTACTSHVLTILKLRAPVAC